MSDMTPGSRLSPELVQLIAYVTATLGRASEDVQIQARVATVVRSSATMLDVTVPSDCPLIDLPDGPTPGNALVYDQEQLVGELLVWVRGGRLIGLEQAWYTDAPPGTWPDPAAVRIG